MKKRKKPESFSEVEEKGKRLEALINLTDDIRENESQVPISFNDFLFYATRKPKLVFRNIYQLFHDMVHHYVSNGRKEDKDTQSIGFSEYDPTKLFVEGSDNPFFADHLFTYRFMNLVGALKKGAQTNRIYLFEGPPGSGKSTFLNTLLAKLEEFTKISEGIMYSTKWVIDVRKFGGYARFEKRFDELSMDEEFADIKKELSAPQIKSALYPDHKLEINCPNNDHPILQIPLSFRRKFLDELIPDSEFKNQLFNDQEYRWVLKDTPCAICSSIYATLRDSIENPLDVFNMVNAKISKFSRQFGEGISIFNPGDPLLKMPIRNQKLQDLINSLFTNDQIRYIYSYLAKTNNGVLAIMDIKENNIQRLMNLHSVISDGVHKVELIEERIKTLFLGLINPEDKKHYADVKSFQDRIITVIIPYVLDYKTEVEIYRSKFGKSIDSHFLPGVLYNFAKIIVSSRLEKSSSAIKSWIKNPNKYNKYIDRDLLLLKMELYAGNTPDWISEEDIKAFDKETRKKIIAESEHEGKKGFSGRKSMNVFNSFFSNYSKKGKLITMAMVEEFFTPKDKTPDKEIPTGFIRSVVDLYDYEVVQQVKEAIYYYNKEQITRDICNYLFSINYEPGEAKNCIYTGDNIEVSDDYWKNFEAIYLGTVSTRMQRESFRRDLQSEYVSQTLAHEIRLEGKKIQETKQFAKLFEKYTRNLKENALAPYQANENFRRAIIEYGKDSFERYDYRIKRDVKLMVNNLQKKFNYTLDGALQVSIYVLDKNLGTKY